MVTLAPPDDVMLRTVLVKLFSDKQIKADEALVSYLLTRMDRTYRAAQETVELLDQEAMARKRSINRALAAELFKDQRELFEGI